MRQLLVVAAGLVLPALAYTQGFPLNNEPETVPAHRFTIPPTIDGVINPDEWAGIDGFSRSLVISGTTQDSGEKGQVWIGYDDEYLYIASRIILQNPKRISADEFRDNVSLRGNDNFRIRLDTFGTTNSKNEISFNANGATSLDITGGRASKLEWSGRVYASARTTPTGWEGEVRVPWALLPMPAAGVRDMTFDVDWYVSATGRRVTTHTHDADPAKIHRLTGVEVPAIDQSRTIQLLPYGYLGYSDETHRHVANAGLDFKSSITPDMIAVGTINPDFRNIEGDVLNLDFSNFERLGNETRPFFREGSDYYFFGHGQRIFASQRISSFDAGMNVYGNFGGKSRVGVLSTVDVGHQGVAAGSYTYNPDEKTELTGSFALLQHAGQDNSAARIALSRQFGNWNLFSESSATNDQIEGTGASNTLGGFYRVPGWNANLFLVDVTPHFFPRVGFSQETGFRGYSGRVTREFDYTSGGLTNSRYSLNFLDYDRLNGSHYRENVSGSTEVTFTNLLNIEAGASYSHFEDRHDYTYGLATEYPQDDPYRRFGIDVTTGRILDTPYRSLGASFRYRPVKRLQVTLRAQSVRHIDNEDQIVMGFNFEKGKYESIGGRVVYDQHDWNWYASYRMSGNLGAEYFLILGDPNAPSFQNTLIFKMTVPISIGG
ncbi:MAG TPA: DUF5916 domain-containing protein [Fimbriimonadaceae bacterium]|nr:DUF5916 domain-containing protein [Fimbriimonadaceae bacterium]